MIIRPGAAAKALSDAVETKLYEDPEVPPKIKRLQEVGNLLEYDSRIRREQQQKLYTHKCAVCGKTDVDYPELEFRYCSRCAGYHCFCSEHINNHIHFTE